MGGDMQTATGWVHPRERRMAFEPKIAVASIVPFAVGAAFAHPHLLAAGPLIAAGAFAAIFLVTLSVSPFAVSYRALGDVVVFLIYGPGIVIGTLLLFGGRVTSDAVTAGTCIGLLLANVLLVDEIDTGGAKTLAARLGRGATSIFGFVFAAAFALPIIMFAAGGSIALLGLLGGVIPADYAVWSLRGERSGRPIAAEAAALIACMTAAAGLIALLLLA
jgi:1,4-dihydroxy-2-naphthoate octaprenyltransferase